MGRGDMGLDSGALSAHRAGGTAVGGEGEGERGTEGPRGTGL